jgi:hypothetical protein
VDPVPERAGSGRDRRRPPIAACLGGGGAFGIGFNMGVTRALRAAGIPVSSGPMLGTSAGAWTAAALAVDADLADILRSWSHAPTEGKARVIELSRALLGDARDVRVSTVAIRIPRPYPMILSGTDHDLADLVAASSSPPRKAIAHRINGHRYIDAGILTTTSADRAPSADLLVVVAPIAGPVLGNFGVLSERMVTLELMRWRATGGKVLFIRPDRAVGALAGTKVKNVLDPTIAEPTYRAAYELGARCAERFQQRHPRLAQHIAG